MRPVTIVASKSKSWPIAGNVRRFVCRMATKPFTLKFDNVSVDLVTEGDELEIPVGTKVLTIENPDANDALTVSYSASRFGMRTQNRRTPLTSTSGSKRTLLNGASHTFSGLVNGRRRKQIQLRNRGAGTVELSNDNDECWYLDVGDSWTIETDANIEATCDTGVSVVLYELSTFHL